MQEQIHLCEQIRQRLRLPSHKTFRLQNSVMLRSPALFSQMLKRFDKKPAGAACRVKNRLAQLRISHCDHEADDGTRSIRLAGVPGGVAHFLEHGFT